MPRTRSRRAPAPRRRRRAACAAPASVSHSSEATQRMLTLASWAKPPARSASADREVGVGQVDVLADQRDRDLLLRVVHPAQQVVPHGPVDVAERQVEAAYDVGVEALAVQHLRDVVDRRGIGGGDHGLVVDVAHQRDLALDARRAARGRHGRRSRRAGCRSSAARPRSAGSAWSSAHRTDRCRAPGETWRKKQLSRPISCRIWRAASRKGSDSMSPTVPPISVITTSMARPPSSP